MQLCNDHPFTTFDPHNLTKHFPPPPRPPRLPTTRVPHPMTAHSLYWGKAHEILFPGWPGSSTGMYVLAVFFIFFLAILVECLAHCQLIKPGSNRVAACFFRTGFRAVRAGLAYMVILAVMSYNGGIFLAAIFGHAVGYLFFGSGLYNKTDGSISSNLGVSPAKI